MLRHQRCSHREQAWKGDGRKWLGDSASASAAGAAPRSRRLRDDRGHRQLDVLRNGRQEPALVARDGVAGHPELCGKFPLRKAEEEPLTTQLPTGQAEAGYPREHRRSTVIVRPLRVVCAWCRRELAPGANPAPTTSHGICETCFARVEAEELAAV